MLANVKDTTPLGEITSSFFEFLTSFCQSIQTLGSTFSKSACQWYYAKIKLYSGDRSLLSDQVDEALSIVSRLNYSEFKGILTIRGTWRKVSSYKITPEMFCPKLGVVNKSWRYLRRFSSVFSKLMESRRFPIEPVLSSAAKMPRKKRC